MNEGQAYEHWLQQGAPGGYRGAFSQGWSDYKIGRSDWQRRAYGPQARSAYIAGRKYAAHASAASKRAK
jgi:hypothetical protein